MDRPARGTGPPMLAAVGDEERLNDV